MIKSLVCPIRQNENNIKRAIDEVENFAKFEQLDDKTAMHLRLLSEELLGMVGTLLDIDEANFWIECDNGHTEFDLKLSALAIVGDKVRKVLVSADSDNKNRAYGGITGILKKAIDSMTSPANIYSSNMEYMAGVCVNTLNAEWSLRSYLEHMEQDDKVDNWDTLEMSILKKLADEILVSVRSESVDITIKYATK